MITRAYVFTREKEEIKKVFEDGDSNIWENCVFLGPPSSCFCSHEGGDMVEKCCFLPSYWRKKTLSLDKNSTL